MGNTSETQNNNSWLLAHQYPQALLKGFLLQPRNRNGSGTPYEQSDLTTEETYNFPILSIVRLVHAEVYKLSPICQASILI